MSILNLQVTILKSWLFAVLVAGGCAPVFGWTQPERTSEDAVTSAALELEVVDALLNVAEDEAEEIRGLFPAAVFPLPVLWQQQNRPRRGPLGRGPRPGLAPAPARRGAVGPALLERLRNLPPAEQARVLENNRRFQQLPPEQQRQLLERLRLWQEMTPEQREMMGERLTIFRNLSPQQQQKAREIYQKHWRTLSPERRRLLLEEFRHLRAMNQEERAQRLASSEFQARFSTEEREVLQQLAAL